MNRKLVTIAATTLATISLAGCAGGSSGSMSLSEAFCSDLKSGLNPMSILGGEVQAGRLTPSQAADRAYGNAAISCPEELQTNQALRTYLLNWNINPDA